MGACGDNTAPELPEPTGDGALDLAYRQGSPQGAFQGASGATRNLVLIAAAGVAYGAGRTPGPCTDCVIVVNAGGDAALQGATITITSTLGGLSTVAATFTMPNPSDSASHRFAVSGIASDWFEVSITGSNGSASVPTVVVCAGFGVESAGSATSSSSGSGANTLEVPFVMARMTTVDNSFLLVGARKVNIAGLTFSNVYFVADLYMTGGATNAEVRLWDTTDGVAITNADVTSTSVTPAEVKSLLVPVGTSAGMLRVDAIKMYQVELHMVGGVLGTDMAFCTNARLVFQ